MIEITLSDKEPITKNFASPDLVNLYLAITGNTNKARAALNEGKEFVAPEIIHSTIPKDSTFKHKNFIEYLEKGWGYHLPIVIAPHTLWFTILTELAEHIKGNAGEYRKHFTESQEKQTIEICTSTYEGFLEGLLEVLKTKVPMNVDLIVPNFSTSTYESKLACYAAFCDAVSPYYNYMMYMCGIPKIAVDGTVDDYLLMRSNLLELKGLGPKLEHYFQVLANRMEEGFSVEFWKGFFSVERCGSGGETEIYGWVYELFLGLRSGSMSRNFPTQIAKVPFLHRGHGKRNLFFGLFTSDWDGEYLKPKFSYVLEAVAESIELAKKE